MGLDMYLYRKQYAHPNLEGVLKVNRKGKPTYIKPSLPTTLSETIGYWRKANQIHRWFVEHVQGGIDDCEEYEASRKQLEELLQVVNKVIDSIKLIPGDVSVGQRLEKGQWVDILEPGYVIENPTVAIELLPRQDGFFFGQQDYNQWYFDELVETRSILEAALHETDDDVWFSYRSSW